MTATERTPALPDRRLAASERELARTPRVARGGVERLRRTRDFEAVMRHGRRARHPLLHLAARHNELPYSRVGYAVSRRVGGAVVRNRVKRRLRAIVRTLPLRSGFDIVAVPQHQSARASFSELSSATETCANRLKVLASESEPGQ